MAAAPRGTDARRYGAWALVTGASSGIGRAFAERLAADGLALVLVARDGARLDALAADLRAAHGVEARALAADLATPQGVAAVEAATLGLDVGLLVAAAGFGTSGPFVAADLRAEREMLEVNCWAVVALARTFAERFAARGRGGVVLFSSLVGRQGAPHAAGYAATKAFVLAFAEALRVELAPRGVDVIACAPGPVHSGFAERASMRMQIAARPDEIPAATLRALGKRDVVVPGPLARFLTASLGVLPRAVRVRAMGRIMRGMTASASDGTSRGPAS